MTSQRFCLRWNNHQSNLLSVFDQLLQDESFVDVTLAVDGRNLKAHKIVLSACSPYFQALFVGHPDRHPIVILKDIPYVDMRSLLDFMYRGEVSVDQDRLTMFLKVAESLRIKGLTEASGDNCDTLAKMGSTLTPTSHPYSALGYPQSRLKRPLSGSQHSLNSLQASNPLLGSALTGPKRKRGLPRKLSGSVSSGLDVMADVPDGEEEGDEEEEGREEDEEFDEERSVQSDSDMIERAHSPFDNKMLEVNVSEGKPAAPSPQGDSSSACNMEERGEGTGSPPCPSPQREEDEEKQASQELATNVKKERETEASGAVDQNDRNSSPVPERFPPGLLRLIPRSELISKDKSGSSEPSRANTKANGNQPFDNLHLLKSLIMNNNVEDFPNKSDENRAQLLSQFSNEHKFILSQLEQFQKNNKKEMIANSNFSLHVQSQHIHQMLTNNNNNNGGVNENHNFLAPNNAGSSPLAVKRRIRRRATSSSDPTESLTEMSVRGLNLFRYASVTEGIYKCMECAKVDVIKTFKNKYSFQRHAFLYHEGCQRKVFPCPVCGKEFSRPDKMKNHMKTVHDCFMPATSPAGRGPRSSPLMIDFAKDGVFDKSLVHNLSIFATGSKGGVGNAPSTASLPLVPFYLPP